MLQRFAAASAIASMGIALAALVVVLTPALGPQRFYPLTALWCFVPALWGLWAMLAPKAWVPQRFPLWGTILGLALGLFIFFVLDLPSLIFEQAVPSWRRGLAVLIIVTIYYLLWMLVRFMYRRLVAPPAAG